MVRRRISSALLTVAVLGVLAACQPPDGRDLAISLAAPPTHVEVGSSTTFAVTVANEGTAPATGSSVNVVAPLGTSVAIDGPASCPAGAYADAGAILATCPIGDVAPGASAVVDVTLTGDVAGVVGDVVVSASSTGGGEPHQGGAPHLTSFPFEVTAHEGVDLHVTGEAPAPVVGGRPAATSRTVVVNRGTVAASAVTITQSLAGPVSIEPGAVLRSGDGTTELPCSVAALVVTCNTGEHPIEPLTDASDRWEVIAGVTAAEYAFGSLTTVHEATSAATEPSPDRWSNTATVASRVELAALVLSAPADVEVGTVFSVDIVDASPGAVGQYWQFDVPETLRVVTPEACAGTGRYSCFVPGYYEPITVEAVSVGGPDSFSLAMQAEGVPLVTASTEIEVIDPSIGSDVHPRFDPPPFGLVGERVTVDGEVRTAGATSHHDVAVVLSPPTGGVLHGARWGDLGVPCSMVGGIATCHVGTVAGHDQQAIDVDVTSYRVGQADLGVAVTSTTAQDDPDPWPDSVVVEFPVRHPFTDLGVTTVHPAQVPITGFNRETSYTVANHGSETASGVELSVEVPEGYAPSTPPSPCTRAERVFTCAWASLPAGEQRTVILRAIVGQPGPGAYVATVSGDQPEPDPDPNPNQVTTPVETVAPHGDLVVTLPGDNPPVVVGEQASRRVEVRNLGPSMVPNTRWQIVVPEGWRIDEVTGDYGHLCTVSDQTIDCGPRVEMWLSTLSVIVRMTPLEVSSGDTLTATVWGELTDPDPSSNSASMTLSSVPVSTDLWVEPWQYGSNNDRFAPGGSGTRQYAVRNAGPAVATDVVVSGHLPDAATITSVSGSQFSCTFEAHDFTCERPTMAAGSSVVLTIGLTWASVPGPLTYEMSVSGGQPEPAPDPNPNALTHHVIAIGAPVGIGVTVLDAAGDPVAGSRVRFYRTTDGLVPTTWATTDADGVAAANLPLGGTWQISIAPPAGSSSPLEWFEDVSSRSQATLITTTAAAPWHDIVVHLG